jgi:sporulation protein YlmC with PRC-barrel domain
MLWLTGSTGQEVHSTNGAALGRVIDLTVRLDGQRETPFVARLLVELRRGISVLVGWDRIIQFEHDRVQLVDLALETQFPTSSVSSQLEPDELLLCRDVLDTQIVDVVGHRLARVADVALARAADGRLEVLAVEVGFHRVLERLGQRRLAGRSPDESIAWSDLHLTSDRGHLVQLGSPASAVHRLTDGDLAALVARLDLDAATEVLDAAGPDRTAGAIAHANTHVAERLLRALPDEARAEVLDHMPDEHAHRWRHRVRHERPLRGRRFFRGAGWRHRHGRPDRAAPSDPRGPGGR